MMRSCCWMLLILALGASAERSVDGSQELLPIGFTPEERTRLDEIGATTVATPPPPDGTRNPAEFETMTGVFIRWPLGVPYNFIVPLSNQTKVWVICLSSEQTTVTNAFTAQGVNMSNVGFVLAPTNSIWVRDYGPWFLMLPDGSSGIFNFTYNRPRPDDDNFPNVLGTAWSLPVYTSDIVHAGGNYMSSGLGISMSTDMVIDENGGNEDWVDSQIDLYCGVNSYFTPPDPQQSYINHIDCWAKMLSPTRILVLQVSPGNPDYAALEAIADLLETMQNPYGTNWQVYRVYSSGTEGYTNSIIVNNRIYVPTWNTANDAPAIAAYQAAVPGYDIYGVYYSGWLNTDAIHCRAMGVTDAEMLWINHTPVASPQPSSTPVVVNASIRCHPTHALTSTLLFHRAGTSGPFTQSTMTSTGGNNYTASIPGAAAGSTVQYYISATDNGGRSEQHPRYAPSTWCHQYSVTSTGIEDETEAGDGFWIASPAPNPFSASVAVPLSLESPAEMVAAVYDLQGRLVEPLFSGSVQGPYSVVWTPGDAVPDGIYIIRIQCGNIAESLSVTLLR
jgi:agmatine deiminase